MACRFLIRVAASIAAVASISAGTEAVFAGGCGCEAPSQTVYHVHQRQGHCHRCAPPMGMLVPAAPMMAAPMMAAPMMAAPMMAAPMMMQAPVMQAPMMMQAPVMQSPVMMQAPMMTMAAPTQSFQLAPAQTCGGSQNALQFSLVQGGGTMNATVTQDQLLKALTQAAMDSQSKSPSAALRGLNGSLEDRVKALEDRVDALKANTDELNSSTLKIIEAVKNLQTKVNE